MSRGQPGSAQTVSMPSIVPRELPLVATVGFAAMPMYASQVILDERIELDAWANGVPVHVVFQSAWGDHDHGNAIWASEPGMRDVSVEIEAANELDAALLLRQAVEPLGGRIICTPPVAPAPSAA